MNAPYIIFLQNTNSEVTVLGAIWQFTVSPLCPLQYLHIPIMHVCHRHLFIIYHLLHGTFTQKIVSNMHDKELDAIQAVTTLSSLLSIFGCGAVLVKLWGNRSSSGRALKSRQFGVLCTIDIFTSVFWCVGVAATENHDFCQFQVLCRKYFTCAYLMHL